MNLLLDIGNTQIKAAVFNSRGQMIFHDRFDKEKVQNKISSLLDSYSVSHALISATGEKSKPLENLLKKKGVVFFYLNAQLKLPFELDYQTPGTLGADRLALSAAAVKKAPEKNRLVIDAGTCITYDFIDRKNIYRGGAISPGIDLRLKSMHHYTANLPPVENIKPEENIPLTGKNTIDCLKSGAVWGAANEIEAFIVNYKLKHKDLTVFLTGGSQIILERYLKNEIFVNSKFLLFEGMNLILNMNK